MEEIEKPDNTKHNEIDLLELGKYIWERRKYVLKYILIGAAAGIVIGFSVPSEFTSTVKMAPEGSNSSMAGNMAGLAALAGMNMSNMGEDGIDFNLYPDIAQSKPFIAEIINIPIESKKDTGSETLYEYLDNDLKSPWWGYIISAPFKFIGWTMSLFKDKDDSQNGKIDIFRLTPEQDDMFKEFGSRTEVAIDKKTGIILASVTMQDPLVAAIVADSVSKKLNEYIITYRTEKAKQDYVFSEKLYQDAKNNYHAAQQNYAVFADANRNISLEAVNIEKQKLLNEQQLAYSIYATMTQQLENAKIKVQEQTPAITIIEPATVPIRKSSTGKLTYLIAFSFLGACFAVVMLLLKKEFFKNVKE